MAGGAIPLLLSDSSSLLAPFPRRLGGVWWMGGGEWEGTTVPSDPSSLLVMIMIMIMIRIRIMIMIIIIIIIIIIVIIITSLTPEQIQNQNQQIFFF